jgi:uncharacterized alkaline shock family protein YloU
MSEGRVGSQGSPLKGQMGNTTIGNTVVAQIAGIATLEAEVEGIQMGGTSAAVGDFLQSVTGSVTGSSGSVDYSRGVSAEVGEEEAAVDLSTTIEYGQSIPQITEAVRRNVINRVESLTGLRVSEVNITVNDVQVPE